jgi:hypothetical protein
MKLDNHIQVKASVQFQNLAIGDVYEDNEGIVCIKTSDDYEDSPYGKCIAFVDGRWNEEEEHRGTYVIPLEATVTLHGYKTQERR